MSIAGAALRGVFPIGAFLPKVSRASYGTSRNWKVPLSGRTGRGAETLGLLGSRSSELQQNSDSLHFGGPERGLQLEPPLKAALLSTRALSILGLSFLCPRAVPKQLDRPSGPPKCTESLSRCSGVFRISAVYSPSYIFSIVPQR